MKNYEFDCGCSFGVLDENSAATKAQTGLPSIEFDIGQAPYGCSKTWDLICSGQTKGVFQLESNLGKSWAKRIRPKNIEELSALISLIRPGCLRAVIDGKSMTQHYVDRKNGTEEVSYLHDSLESILKSTQGVLVYQEQSMQIAQVIAGFNLQQGDNLRKAIGKKQAGLMASVKDSFLNGSDEKGVVSREIAEEIFGWIEKSNRYAFNKSHAVSYAVCAYWSAYAKAHFPINFYCNYLFYANGKQDPQSEIRDLVRDAKISGIKVSPPSIINMDAKFSIRNKVINFGFNDIKSVGEKHVEKLMQVIDSVESDLSKPIADWSWYQFLVNASHKINKNTMVSLASVGSMSHFGISRSKMLYEFETWQKLTDKEKEWVIDRQEQWECLVDALSQLSPTKKKGGGTFNTTRSSIVESLVLLLEDPPYSVEDSPGWVSNTEKEALGIALSYSEVDSCDISGSNSTCKEFFDGKRGNIILAVQISNVNEYIVKNGRSKGSPMGFLSVEDNTGCLDTATVFCDEWKKYRGILYEGNTVLLHGKSSGEAFRGKSRYQIDDGFIVQKVSQI
jgi:DNA polymerase-3 subunit alpha